MILSDLINKILLLGSGTRNGLYAIHFVSTVDQQIKKGRFFYLDKIYLFNDELLESVFLAMPLIFRSYLSLVQDHLLHRATYGYYRSRLITA